MSHTATCELDGHLDDPESPSLPAWAPESLALPGHPEAPAPANPLQRLGAFIALREVRWAGLSTLLFLFGLALRGLGVPVAGQDAVFICGYVAGGWEPGLAGLRALRDRRLDVDLLMVVAAVVAAGIGQVLDGGLLIVIFATSGALEAVATKRTRDAVRSLLTFAPEQATRLRRDGAEEQVDTKDLAVGDVLMIRPGERIGADARVVAGASEVDQASITGEPLPAVKVPGDEVFAGTINGEGSLQAEVLRPAADSVVARIVALVEAASATKAKTQLFIDRVEQRYSVGMVVATLALFVVPLLLGRALQPTLLRAMTFMIVASPCAVVLATMPPLLAAIANAGRHGVLVKSAVVMEQLGSASQVAFDKTGTLTEGTPQVDGVHALTPAISEAEVLGWAAGAENPSEHPLARAIVAAARARDVELPEVVEFRSTPGLGVSVLLAGRNVRVGSPALLAEVQSGEDTAGGRAIERIEAAGHTAVVVLADGALVGVIALADKVRAGAAATVRSLTALTGNAPVLLTGDNARAGAALGSEVGITDVRAGLLPEDKARIVRELESGDERVLVVGDGVNDAPALAAATLGIAMGRHGSDLALETADAVIVRNEIAMVPAAIAISRQAKRVVTANLVIAGTVIAALVAIDLFGHLPLPFGVAGHETSTVVVGLNGLRLLRGRHWIPARSL